MNREIDAHLRAYEAVLDNHHQTLGLWRRPRPEAIYACFATIDSLIVPILLASPASDLADVSTAQLFKSYEEALGQCVRWLIGQGGSLLVRPTCDMDTINEAGDFLGWGRSYVDLADMHKMYGRGHVEVMVNPEVRRVKFFYRSAADAVQTVESFADSLERIRRLLPRIDSVVISSLWGLFERVPYRLAAGRVSIQDFSFIRPQEVENLVCKMLPSDEPYLSVGEDLCGFSVGELSAFWQSVFLWSFVAQNLYLKSAFTGVPQEECMPVQVVEYEFFVRQVASMSGLSTEKVANIASRFTYDPEALSPEVLMQPFLVHEGSMAWSTWAVVNSRYKRNMLKIMARSSEFRDAAARIIGSREDGLLNELGRFLAKRGGFQYKLTTEILADKVQGEIDLLAYTPKAPQEILVVEAKALLSPDEVNEVNSATKEISRAQGQLERAMEILASMTLVEKKERFRFVPWDKIATTYGLVVCSDFSKNIGFQGRWPAVSLAFLVRRLKAGDYRSPRRLHDACRERRWLDDDLAGFDEILFKEIKVGEVIYEVPVLLGG